MSDAINFSHLDITSAQPPPSRAPQPKENSQCFHFVRRLITALLFLFVLISVVSWIAWLIVHPLGPVFTVSSFTVSNLTLSNNNDSRIKADYHLVFSLKNPNKKVPLVINNFEILLLYKNDTVLIQTWITEAVSLEKMSQKNWSPEFPRDFGEPLHGREFNEIGKDWSKRVVSFDVKMKIEARFTYGIWLSKRRIMKVSCINLVVEFLEPRGINGKLRVAGGKVCSFHLA